MFFVNQRKVDTSYSPSLSDTNAVFDTEKCILYGFHAITAFRAEGVQTALVLFRRPAYSFRWCNCSSQT